MALADDNSISRSPDDKVTGTGQFVAKGGE